ncbi:uracil DNA N-glycosylase Thp1 [Didymosphaeria variabile]|uniref:Uracil DNA N-glycosylase Thp1 n=1 Tax=Didymosphaeria variabile TaxID=1932322 RepID=A0A9W8XTI3_9PLEO|nr:uracil DNA N-glycosylase Thp1 [Didymosphaeria variabile]KAJ4358304.1 uracil DNA N-glycosylase Thp1 [Didymosphaeria variabile]
MRAKTAEEEVPKLSPRKDQASDTEPTATVPTTASFKGQLLRFQYNSTTSASDDASPKSPVSVRSPKRTRTAVTIAATTDDGLTEPSPRPQKKRKSSSYAPSSRYAHLSPLVDILEPNLICVFVGTNPGVQTATAGHAYAHPSNHFWKLLHASGLTDRRLSPTEDRSLPAKYCMGNTNIVSRPSKNAAELSKEEMVAGAGELEAKFREFRPEAVCIVGKGIWEAIWKYRKGRAVRKEEFRYGWQDEEMNMGKIDGEESSPGSRVFVTTSTSGLAANLRPAEKEAIWRPFGEWVQKRREERGFVPRKEEGSVQKK